MKETNPTKEWLHELIFEADTPAGRTVDIILIVLIVLSVIVVFLESIESLNARYGTFFIALEWIFTIAFTIEYALRLYSVYRPMKYALSFFGIIDLLAILPTFISLLIPEAKGFTAVRALRIIRVFRIFKLVHFTKEGALLLATFKASKAKITVTLVFIVIVAVIMGSIMYFIEGEINDTFDSIPRSIYWAIVTLTTVGYGDISPQTPVGQFIAAAIMIIGYVVIAAGIVSVDSTTDGHELKSNSQACRYCGQEGHDNDALYCKYCGETLNVDEEEE